MNDRNSPAYKWWKDTVLKRDRYTCQDCRQISGYLDVHHIESFAENVNLRFDPGNGVTLCPLCHGKRHGRPNGFTRVHAVDKIDIGRTMTITLDDETEKVVEELRKAENRSWKNMVESIIKRWISVQGDQPKKSESDLPW